MAFTETWRNNMIYQQKINYLKNQGIVMPEGADPATFLSQYYNDPINDAPNQNKASSLLAPEPTTNISSQEVKQGFQKAGEGITKYEESLAPLQEMVLKEDLSKGIAGTEYTPFDWQKPEYTPVDYQKTDYTFADEYQSPEAYQAAQYTMPDLKTISDDLWAGQEAASRERVAQQYGDTRERMREELLRNPGRAEQAAALMATIGEQEAAAQTAAQRDLAFGRAQSELGVNQAQAQLKLQAEEAQAREMANKYGLDIDAARYLVQQNAAQQAAQAAENQFATTYGQGEARYQTGLEQALQEQKAAEAQKAYQAEYGQQQDLAQMKLAQNEAQRAAQLDYANAMLQAQQAQSQQAAQQATYQTNLTEGERNKANELQKGYNATLSAYNAANKPTTTIPTGGNKALASTGKAATNA